MARFLTYCLAALLLCLGTALPLQAQSLPAPTTLTLTSSKNPSLDSEMFTLTATVQSIDGSPRGKVTFYDGATELGNVITGSNEFPWILSGISPGTHSFRAVYSDLGGTWTSSESSLSQVVIADPAVPTTTTLASSANPSFLGSPVTLTATVTSNSGVPTGYVEYYDGPSIVATRPLNAAGVATFDISLSRLGSFNLTAKYTGRSTQFKESSSEPLVQIVEPPPPQPTVTTITSSRNPSREQQLVTLTARVAFASGTLTGYVEFRENGILFASTTLNPLVIDNQMRYGVASLTTSFALGSHAITANFVPTSGLFEASSSQSLIQVVNPYVPPTEATVTKLTSSPNPAGIGELITLKATVTAATGIPTGTVKLYFGFGPPTTATLDDDGVAKFFQIFGNSAGQYEFRAEYVGETAFFGSTSEPYTQIVNDNPPKPTTTKLTSSLNPSVEGDAITFLARVSSVFSGTVEFRDNGTHIGYAAVSGEVAAFTTTSLSRGSHNITAHFSGSPGFEPSNSDLLTQTVAPPVIETITSISSSLNPSRLGDNVALTATVSANGNTPNGEVEFYDGATLLGSGDMSGGVATLSLASLNDGAHVITARFLGSTGFAPSSSPVLFQTVNIATTMTTLVSSQNPSVFGQSVTFTATVNSAGGTPTGLVEFYDGATLLGSDMLTNGSSSLTSSGLPIGAHSITARYSGTESFAGSTSAAVNQSVGEDYSGNIDRVQQAATSVAAQIASETITNGVAEEIAAALSGQVQVISASDGKVGLVYAPGVGKSIIVPTADLASGGNEIATWRIWSRLRYADFGSSDLAGDQINALLGTTILFGDGLAAGLVAGYEKQDYEDDVNATLKGEGFNIGGYAGGTLGNGTRFDVQVHSSFLNYDLAAGPVSGSTDATRLIIGGGFAHRMQFGATTFEPTARFNGTWEWQDGYTDSAAVLHSDRDLNFGRIAAGAKLAHRIDIGGGAILSPFVQGFADYRFSGGDVTSADVIEGFSARIGIGANFQTKSGIDASALAEFSGLGLENNVMVQSYNLRIAIPF